MPEINDILGLGKITIALLDKFEKLGGFIFTPIQLKRVARTQIQLVKEIKESIDGDLKINITKDNVSIECHKDNSLVGHNITNIISSELNKQENINNIVSKTIEILEQKKLEKTEVNIEKDWLNNYIECVKNVSDDEMQDIWAKILADETENEGSYSISTLNILKNMSKQDAMLYTKVAKCVFIWSGQFLLLNVDKCKHIYDISLLDIMTLDDLGLINDSGKTINYSSGNQFYTKTGFVFNHKRIKNSGSMPIMTLTRAGRELKRFVQEEKVYSDEELKTIFNCSNGFELSLHLKISDTSYMTMPIKTLK